MMEGGLERSAGVEDSSVDAWREVSTAAGDWPGASSRAAGVEFMIALMEVGMDVLSVRLFVCQSRER